MIFVTETALTAPAARTPAQVSMPRPVTAAIKQRPAVVARAGSSSASGSGPASLPPAARGLPATTPAAKPRSSSAPRAVEEKEVDISPPGPSNLEGITVSTYDVEDTDSLMVQ